LTRGRAATPDPFDLSAVSTSDELFDALSARRLDDHAETDDPAAALLTALVADVDAGAPPLPAPARVGCGRQSSRRRGTRAVVTLGVAALVLTSAGAAAAGGGDGVGAMGAANLPSRPRGTERSNENLQRQDPIGVTGSSGRRPAPRRTTDKRRNPPPQGLGPRAAEDETTPAPEGQQHWGHRTRRSSKGYLRSPADLRHSPDPRSSSDDDRHEPVSWPEYAPVTP
jgi:hypothetical protein